VLGVHGDDRVAPGPCPPDELAADHERFLVGEGEDLPGGERGEGRAEPPCAHDRVQDEVHLGKGSEMGQPVRSVDDLRLRRDERPQPVRLGGAGDPHPSHRELADGRGQGFHAPPGRDRDDFERTSLPPQSADHVQGLGPDRARRPKDGDPERNRAHPVG